MNPMFNHYGLTPEAQEYIDKLCIENVADTFFRFRNGMLLEKREKVLITNDKIKIFEYLSDERGNIFEWTQEDMNNA